MMAVEEEDVLQDDHTKRKVFALAGFNSSQEVKVDLVTKIRALGGEVRESPVWSDGVTHVVAANFGHYLEKVMGGLVTGAWVITRRFVEASHQRGQWANTKAYVCDDLVLHHRRRRLQLGGIFSEMRAAFVLSNPRQGAVYTRLVRAGGGHVLPHSTLRQLIDNSEDIAADLNFVIIDNDQHPDWAQWSQIVQRRRDVGQWKSLRHVQYKYLFNIITKCDPVSVREFLIDDTEKMMVDSKREHASNDDQIVKRFKRDPLIVNLDSDSDDDIEVLEAKLKSQKLGRNRRVYFEKNYTGEVITIEDDEKEDADAEEDPIISQQSSRLSVGLQQAISALQPQRRPLHSSSRSRPVDTAEDEEEEEVEVVMQKQAEARKSTAVDARSALFQSRLRSLQSDGDEVGSESSQSQDEAEAVTSRDRSPSPVVEPVEILPPAQLIPELEATDKLLLKVVDCLLERQSITGECATVGWAVCRAAKYDKHGEAPRRTGTRLVDSSVREEFNQKFVEAEAGQEQQLSQVSSTVSSLRFLGHYTSLTTHPTPAILHRLMLDCVLRQDSAALATLALQLLHLALGRHLACLSAGLLARDQWVAALLSACRPSDLTDFDSFDLENKQDTARCAVFFQTILRDLRQQPGRRGAAQLLQFLVTAATRDLQLAWRPQRSSAPRPAHLPLVFHLLGDTNQAVMATIKKLVVPLYTSR